MGAAQASLGGCCTEIVCKTNVSDSLSHSQVADVLLMQSVMRGDIAGVTRALNTGADPNTTEQISLGLELDDGRLRPKDAVRTPLMWACSLGQVEIVRALIAGGADPSAVDERGWTALCFALGSGHVSLARELFEGVDQLRDRKRHLLVLQGKRPQILAHVRDEVANVKVASEVCQALNSAFEGMSRNGKNEIKSGKMSL